MRPANPKRVASSPGNSASFHGGRNDNSHAWANDELARYALQLAEYGTASPTPRPKPLACCRARYGQNAGATTAIDTTAAMPIAVQYRRSVHSRRVTATTATA